MDSRWTDGADGVEVALADAIKRATEAGEWGVVGQLARELEARRVARASAIDLAVVCTRKAKA